MNARIRGLSELLAEGAGASRPEQAARLRARAASIREELEAQERALEERRAADEAGALDAEARELDLEQERTDTAAELRRQAEAEDAAAVEIDRQVTAVDEEMVDSAMRAARFENQIADEVVSRRDALEQQSAEAAEAGDAEALLAAERDMALLPTLETKLREQADAAAARASDLNDEAGRLESVAGYHRQQAGLLRQRAVTDPLAPPVSDPKQIPFEMVERGALAGSWRADRTSALDAIRQRSDLHEQDRPAVAALFEEARGTCRASRVAEKNALVSSRLDEVARRLPPVNAAAHAQASPWNGKLFWIDMRPGVSRDASFKPAQAELAEAVEAYLLASGRTLPACTYLATNPSFEVVDEVSVAFKNAMSELASEREAVDALRAG